jgi:hypothetical protein
LSVPNQNNKVVNAPDGSGYTAALVHQIDKVDLVLAGLCCSYFAFYGKETAIGHHSDQVG